MLQAINTRMVTDRSFVAAGKAVALKPEGRKAFYQAYEARMDTLVTHPLFDYWLSYRRMLKVQAGLLASMWRAGFRMTRLRDAVRRERRTVMIRWDYARGPYVAERVEVLGEGIEKWV